MGQIFKIFFMDKVNIILSVFSVALLVASWIVPPTGAIDPSVMGAVGEIFAFGLLINFGHGIESGKFASLRYKDSEISIGDVEPRRPEPREPEEDMMP